MGGQPVQVVRVIAGQSMVETGPEALGGLGGVLGDIPGDLLRREPPGLAIDLGEVVDVKLLTPAGEPLRPAIDRRAGYGHGRNGLLEGVLEQAGTERLRWWGKAVRAAAGGSHPSRMTAWKWIAPRR